MGNFTPEQAAVVGEFVAHLKGIAAERRYNSPAAIQLIDDAVETFLAEPHAADEQATAYIAEITGRVDHYLTGKEAKALRSAFLAGFDAALPQAVTEMAAEQSAPNGWASVNA